MFKEMGQMASLIKNLPKIREEMGKFQEKLGQIIGEGDAGGGMVKVRVNGKLEVMACQLSDEAMRLNDREMLEELFRAATNQALEKARQLVAQETAKMASNLGLPPGLGLPGLGSETGS